MLRLLPSLSISGSEFSLDLTQIVWSIWNSCDILHEKLCEMLFSLLLEYKLFIFVIYQTAFSCR